jgi:hypothetical protein
MGRMDDSAFKRRNWKAYVFEENSNVFNACGMIERPLSIENLSRGMAAGNATEEKT